MLFIHMYTGDVNAGNRGDLSGLGKGMVDGGPFDAGMLGSDGCSCVAALLLPPSFSGSFFFSDVCQRFSSGRPTKASPWRHEIT